MNPVDVLTNESGTNQTVRIRMEGMGAWGAAAIVACFATWAALIVLMIWLVPILHDQSAYIARHSDQIAKLQVEQKK